MDIDLLDPETFKGGHPAAVYDHLLAEAPVYWHDEPNGSGFWAVTRYQDVYDIGRNAAVFSSSPTIMIQDPGLIGGSTKAAQPTRLTARPSR